LPGATGPTGPSAATVRFEGPESDPISAENPVVFSLNGCPISGNLVGGGYVLIGTDAQKLDVQVIRAEPDAMALSYRVEIMRRSAAGDGAKVKAFVLCRP
jgi:hypothetical protein